MISSLYYALNKYFKSCDILQIRCPTFLYIFLHKFSRNYIVSRMKRIFKKRGKGDWLKQKRHSGLNARMHSFGTKS